MNKTKEEIFKFFWNLSTGKQADEMTLRHMAWVLNAMEEYGNQCRKEGFEEGKKKIKNYIVVDSEEKTAFQSDDLTFYCDGIGNNEVSEKVDSGRYIMIDIKAGEFFHITSTPIGWEELKTRKFDFNK